MIWFIFLRVFYGLEGGLIGKGVVREDSFKRVCSFVGDIDCCLDLGGDNGYGERWMGLRYIFKVEIKDVVVYL